MKKISLIILLIGLLACRAYGATFHAIIFANTADSKIGNSVAVDLGRMGIEMTAIAKSIGYPIKKHFYHGSKEQFSRQKLESVIRSIDCSSDDIVFFYYSGHGGRAHNGKTMFPEMCLNVNEPLYTTHLFALHDVYTLLKAKKPGLAIVMGDLCNSVIKGYSKHESSASRGATVLSKESTDVYRNLFLNVRGSLIVASSEPGYISGCYRYYDDDGEKYDLGGYMTHSFLTVLQDCVGKNRDVSWEQLMNATVAHTQFLTRRSDHPQTPVFKADISPTVAPVLPPDIAAVPQAPDVSAGGSHDQNEILAYDLSMVCNRSVPKLDRIRNIATARKHFKAANTRVQVLGADNRTIVNTCGIDSYLNYLSMATNMDQVLILETVKNSSGDIGYIKVHEIHYQ